ncbi:transposase [Viridibacillus sp. YIM B01967]|uniref:Transposase n=1 Tax=Viridibacillus soli TaxID=2798301 RepID=A0ABS1H3G5_9BACL|nr:helix-turn-helix domain-containing protein [Viridibacillus soli]MBK3493959.1 transposase [Viridibacillus soli]
MGKIRYSSEVKWAVVKEKLAGKLTTKEIMQKYGIKNNSQVESWMHWYRNNEISRWSRNYSRKHSLRNTRTIRRQVA